MSKRPSVGGANDRWAPTGVHWRRSQMKHVAASWLVASNRPLTVVRRPITHTHTHSHTHRSSFVFLTFHFVSLQLSTEFWMLHLDDAVRVYVFFGCGLVIAVSLLIVICFILPPSWMCIRRRKSFSNSPPPSPSPLPNNVTSVELFCIFQGRWPVN